MSQFRLATLLKLRIDDRDRRRLEFAQAVEAQRILEERIEEIEAERTTLLSLANEHARPGSANVDAMLQLNRYQAQLAGQRRALDGQLAQVTTEAERRRAVLVEADRQVRVLEKLREKQLENEAADALRREVKEFDEASLVVFRQQLEARS